MIFEPLLDFFRSRAVTIPPMDGALKPNTLLEEAEVLRSAIAPDNLVIAGGAPLYSSGNELRALSGGALITSFASPIAAMASTEGGRLAVALDNGVVDAAGTAVEGFNCPTALAFGSDGALYVCNGSEHVLPSGWVNDLMSKGASGSVWKVFPGNSENICLARNLAFPYGIAVDETNGRLIVSESWHHRIITIPLGGGAPSELLGRLPGYPSRIVKTPHGYLMPLFAPRNRLIEFVLLEDDYRAAMMSEIDPPYWIAPSLSASHSFLEPLQNGSVISMGIHKPWSPTRSYGLVVVLDNNLEPQSSFHSRANGRRHGVTSAIFHEGAIIAASKGGNAILRLPLEATP